MAVVSYCLISPLSLPCRSFSAVPLRLWDVASDVIDATSRDISVSVFAAVLRPLLLAHASPLFLPPSLNPSTPPSDVADREA
eukprot:1007588-Rhodomonas_salina.3